MLGAVMVALLLATPGALADFACDSGTLSSTCVVSTAQVITAPITGADLTIESGGSLTCDTPLCEASIALTGTLVVAGTIKAGNVHVSAADITVSGTVSADYLGYPAARGPGAGHNATVHSCDSRFSGSGGAHGGNGGTANSKTAYSGCDISPSFNAVGGDGYGDLYEPTTPGSGGQHAWHYGTSGDDVIHAQGGAGGGAMCVPHIYSLPPRHWCAQRPHIPHMRVATQSYDRHVWQPGARQRLHLHQWSQRVHRVVTRRRRWCRWKCVDHGHCCHRHRLYRVQRWLHIKLQRWRRYDAFARPPCTLHCS